MKKTITRYFPLFAAISVLLFSQPVLADTTIVCPSGNISIILDVAYSDGSTTSELYTRAFSNRLASFTTSNKTTLQCTLLNVNLPLGAHHGLPNPNGTCPPVIARTTAFGTDGFFRSNQLVPPSFITSTVVQGACLYSVSPQLGLRRPNVNRDFGDPPYACSVNFFGTLAFFQTPGAAFCSN